METAQRGNLEFRESGEFMNEYVSILTLGIHSGEYYVLTEFRELPQ